MHKHKCTQEYSKITDFLSENSHFFQFSLIINGKNDIFMFLWDFKIAAATGGRCTPHKRQVIFLDKEVQGRGTSLTFLLYTDISFISFVTLMYPFT